MSYHTWGVKNSLYYTWIVENLAYLHSSICAVENIAAEVIIDSLFPFERNQSICCNFSIILFLLMKSVLRRVCNFSIILYCMRSTKKTEDLYFASQTIANIHHLQTWHQCKEWPKTCALPKWCNRTMFGSMTSLQQLSLAGHEHVILGLNTYVVCDSC